MNYRLVMRILAPLAAVILVLAGCAAEKGTPATEAGPCSITANGDPATATGYRTNMTPVRTSHYAVVTICWVRGCRVHGSAK